MKNLLRKIKVAVTGFIVTLTAVAFCFACAPEPSWSGGKVGGFALPHVEYAINSGNSEYNSDLFYNNSARVRGADPGAVYVSDEDIEDSYDKRRKDYQYFDGSVWKWQDGWSEDRFTAEYGDLDSWKTECSDRFFCVTTEVGTKTSKDDPASIAGIFGLFSSQDLMNWVSYGKVYNGSAVLLYDGEWTKGAYAWAPEIIRDEASGLYMIFFSAASRNGGKDDLYVTNKLSSTWDTLYVSCAIADKPCGPYRLATAEKYLYATARKNADGTVVRGTESKPSADLDRDGEPDKDLYEIYSAYNGNVIGYVDEAGKYYNLNGYVIDATTPMLNIGYYFPRLSTNKSKVEEFERKYHITNVEKYADSGIDNCICPAIDVNPVVDSQGNKYLYFSLHESSFIAVNNVWIVSMKDWLSPEWDTFQKVAAPDYETVIQDGSLDGVAMGNMSGEYLNEGTFVIERNGKWYLTYSPYGFGDKSYSVHVAIADSPFGPFVKQGGKFSPIIGVGEEPIDEVGGTGHHCFVMVEDEMWAIYHCFSSGYSVSAGRSIAADRIIWKYEPSLGCDMMYGNGPTYNLQPKPEACTGYTDVAKFATVTGNGDSGDISYLTDGMFTAQPFSRKYEYGKSDGGLELHFKWEQAVSVKAIMIYTGGSAYQAFSKVDSVVFKLAEKPDWYTLSDYNGYCYVKDLAVDPFEFMAKNEIMRKGSAAIAEFNEIKITELHLYFSGNEESKFLSVDENFVQSKAVAVSEVYFFGRVM